MKIAYAPTALLMTAFALTASVASAEDISLTTPKSGATLHEGGIDMSVYYTDTQDGLEVVATYTPRVSAYAPQRMTMLLQDGDAVSFGLPGVYDLSYSFSRTGDAVAVRAVTNSVQLASN